jgi:hypothetical protein
MATVEADSLLVHSSTLLLIVSTPEVLWNARPSNILDDWAEKLRDRSWVTDSGHDFAMLW